MNFFLDESVDAPVAYRLRGDGHTVVCVWELEPGISDDEVLARADRDRAILVTADKDFGELVFRLGRVHHGVLLIRLAGLPLERTAGIVSEAVREHGRDMCKAFTVVTPGLVRLRRPFTPGTDSDTTA